MAARRQRFRFGGAAADAGFTLVEILVALAILGLSLGVLLGALHTASIGSRAAAARAEALSVAQSLLAAQDGGAGAFGAQSGVTSQGDQWTIVTKPWPEGDAAGAVGEYWVQVQVARGGAAPVTLTTLLVGPAYDAR